MNGRRLLWVVWTLTVAVLALLGGFVGIHLASQAAPSPMTAATMSHAVFAAGGNPVGGTLLNLRFLTSWQLDTTAVAVVVVLAACYLTGWLLARRRHPEFTWPWQRALAFAAGLFLVVFATCGSIAVYDKALFSAHMLGHLTLVMAAPVMLLTGRPLTLWRASRRDPARFDRIAGGRVVSVLTAPPVALASYTAVIVGAHLTGLMNLIMTTTWLGQLEHAVYLLVGLQFFVLAVGDEPIRWRLPLIGRLGLLAVGMAVDTFTGVVLLMSTQPVAMAAPVDALSDTRTGGAIMWVGGDGLMMLVMATLVLAYQHGSATSEREQRSWLEQVRRATFEANTEKSFDVEAGQPATDFDDDDRRRAAYNDWLARLERAHK